jgi:hypothetical protein
LIVVVNGTADADANLRLRFNSDTGSNYFTVRMSGNGSSTFSDANSISNAIQLDQFGFFNSTRATTLVQVMDYSATDKHKTVLSRGNNSSNGVSATAGRYASTSALTSVNIITSSGNLNSGTTLNLFGVIA